jgi:hypothetical protein
MARGLYALYGDTGVHYVGRALGEDGLGKRLADHVHEDQTWSRFSWFAIGRPELTEVATDGVVEYLSWSAVDDEDPISLRGVMALIQAIAVPPHNKRRTHLHGPSAEWVQVATRQPDVRTIASLRRRLGPTADNSPSPRPDVGHAKALVR